MKIAVASYSFHRLLAAGRQDIFQYIKDCKRLGCTHLDPWNAHLVPADHSKQPKHNPRTAGHLTPPPDAFVREVKSAADEAGLPFGCIAVDGAHLVDPSESAMRENRERAYRWLDVAGALSAESIRIDAGGTEEMPDEEFAIIIAGFKDILHRASQLQLNVMIENHWGCSIIPRNLLRILEGIPDLGLLLDSFNWKFGKQTEGWLTCAKYAKATHIKSFAFTKDGEELTTNVCGFVNRLRESGFSGPFGIESVPYDGDEIEAARKTIALVRKYAAE